MPLPLTVKTPQDMAFKTVAERLYLTFNLMASGRLAWQRGDYAGAAEKWETLLRTPGLDPQVERVITPLLADARRRAGSRPAGAAPPACAFTDPSGGGRLACRVPHQPAVAKPIRPDVTGVVLGGGDVGPAGAVVWLKRLDGRTPQAAPTSGRFITQRKKIFLPHVLAVPKGSTVEFRNEDAIYHNAFSLDKPNDFDAGIRAKGNTYSRTFDRAGAGRDPVQYPREHERFRGGGRLALFRQDTRVGDLHHRQGSPRTIRAVRVARERIQHHPQEDLGRRRWRKRHLGVRRGR